MDPLAQLFDETAGAPLPLPLPPELLALYGPLRLGSRPDRPLVFANFVASLDGIVAVEDSAAGARPGTPPRMFEVAAAARRSPWSRTPAARTDGRRSAAARPVRGRAPGRAARPRGSSSCAAGRSCSRSGRPARRGARRRRRIAPRRSRSRGWSNHPRILARLGRAGKCPGCLHLRGDVGSRSH